MIIMQQETLKTGTTTVGILFKDGVILASESKSTMGWLVASKTSQKIYPVDEKIAVTTAGGAGDTQALIRIVKAEINLYKITRNAEFTVKAATSLLSNILSNNRYYPYMAMLIVGGFDRDGPHLWSVDAVGGAEEEKSFTATGSGSPVAFGVLENDYKENMTKDEAVRLAVRSIRSARERDVMSGGKEINVTVITKDGMEQISQEKTKELAK
ncbi:MAG: archaeal proteasome endopeptidase complex subunit beta [Candidatus Aenigmarchaeota archaeon]|nr:archaeal proteasome endopeptidase complex subunit beta [Candidatus Aenigmarchaeota archaeon]